MKKTKYYGWLFILPSLIGVLIFYIIPFFLSIYYTFTKGVADVKFVWFDNFRELFNNPAFLLAAKNTIMVIIVGVPLITLLSLSLSLMMSDKLYKFPRWAMLSPMIVPVASALMGWSVLFGNEGIINRLFIHLCKSPIDFFGERHAMAMLIFIFIIKNAGYMLIIFTGAVSAMEKEYKEAFFLDSDSNIKYAYKIVIPLICPIIFFVVILCIINSFQMFREVYTLYGNYPPNTVYLLQNFMNNNFFKLNYQRLSTSAFLLIMGLAVIIVLFLKFQRKFLDE